MTWLTLYDLRRTDQMDREARLANETRARLMREIANYLTRQFIWHSPAEMPEDECLPEARHILSMIDAALEAK